MELPEAAGAGIRPAPLDRSWRVASGHRLQSCAGATENLCVPRLDYKAGLGQRKGKHRTERRSDSLEGEFTRLVVLRLLSFSRRLCTKILCTQVKFSNNAI